MWNGIRNGHKELESKCWARYFKIEKIYTHKAWAREREGESEMKRIKYVSWKQNMFVFKEMHLISIVCCDIFKYVPVLS